MAMLQRELQLKQELIRRNFDSERDDEYQRQQVSYDRNLRQTKQLYDA